MRRRRRDERPDRRWRGAARHLDRGAEALSGWLRAARRFAELSPVATIRADGCTRRHGSDCAICADACPRAAITLDRLAATVDPDACIGCGLCLPVCPVGAVEAVGPEPAATAARISAGGHTIRCRAARDLGAEPRGDWTDVPCLATLHPETVAAGVIAGGPVELLRSDCVTCPVGAGARVDELVDRARAVAGDGDAVRVTEATVERGPGRRRRRTEAHRSTASAMSRRALFGLRTVDAAPDVPPPATPVGDAPRELLLSVASDPPLPRLAAGEGCTGCEGCVRICPTGALDFADGTLSFDPASCVACGECVRTCPESVLRLEGRAPGGPTGIAQVPQRRCSRCRAALGPGEEGACHRCRTRADLADDVWKHLAR